MGAPNVKRILARWPYPEAAVEAYSTAMTAAFGHQGAWELIEKAVDNCAAGEKTDIRALLDALGALSEECGVPSQTLRQLPLIASLDAAEARYRALGLSGEMFRDSFADLLWKTRECFRRFGVWGSAAAAWDWGFFELRIFGLGRLQFEPLDYAGKPALNVHIPSSRPLIHAECLDSYVRAQEFFGLGRFVVDSWLLHPVCLKLRPDSGIRQFMADYELQFITDDPQFLDVWNIFGVAWEGDAEKLPADTSLRRIWREHLLSGGIPGRGFGLYESF